MSDDHDPCAGKRLAETSGFRPVEGRLPWDPVHSSWNGGMLAAALVLGPPTVSPAAVKGAGVQSPGVPWAAIRTMGEAWHNNHHALPGSARIGLYSGQADCGFRFIQLLERQGLSWNVRTTETMGPRKVLARGEAAR